MNMLSKIAIFLLALSILAIPVMASEDEEDLIIIKEDPIHSNIVYMTHVSVPGHDTVPEHAELRPFFRDSDPEFVITDARPVSYPVENVTGGAEFLIRTTTAAGGTEEGKYEYAAIP